MTTPVLRVSDRSSLPRVLAQAGELLREGGIVAFPTETVYGLAASALHPGAIERLYAIKGRERSKPMTLMIADLGAVEKRAARIPPAAARLMKHFWPGPMTLVLDAAPDAVAGPEAISGAIGFRWPDHPLALGLVRAAGVPLLVPSANRAGEAAATNADDVLAAFPEELDLVIDGGPSTGGTASTVVRVHGDDVTVLREGAIPTWRIEDPNEVRILFVCTGNTDRSPLAAAILRRRLAERFGVSEEQLGGIGYRVASAGLAAAPNHRASRPARDIAKRLFQPPLDIEGHRSRVLSTADVRGASHIFCMERDHVDQILAFFPGRERDVRLLDPEGGDVADPAGKNMATYERLARRLDAAAALIVGSVVGRRAI